MIDHNDQQRQQFIEKLSREDKLNAAIEYLRRKKKYCLDPKSKKFYKPAHGFPLNPVRA